MPSGNATWFRWSDWQLVGRTHFPAVHTPPLQSLLEAHAAPTPHCSQLPPQSTSLSLPFLSLSPHDAAAARTPPVHTPEAQSLPAPHFWPSAHVSQPPPQSTSDSAAFRLASLHEELSAPAPPRGGRATRATLSRRAPSAARRGAAARRRGSRDARLPAPSSYRQASFDRRGCAQAPDCQFTEHDVPP